MGMIHDLEKFARSQIGKDPGRAFDNLLNRIQELCGQEPMPGEVADQPSPPPTPYPGFAGLGEE